MDALSLLQEVSTAYHILHTLSLEATVIMESGDLGFIGGGTGSIRTDPANPQRTIEHSTSHHVNGDSLVETSKWILRGKPLTFERRLTFSDNDSNLTVDKHITGPAGDHQKRYTRKV